MRYIIFRIAQKIKCHIKIYCIIMLEIILGFALMLVGLNAMLSANEKANAYISQMDGKFIAINSYSKDATNLDKTLNTPSITLEDYNQIASVVGEENVEYLVLNHLAAVTKYDEVVDLNAVMLSPNLFYKLLGVYPSDNYIYGNKKIIEQIKNGNLSFLSGEKINTGIPSQILKPNELSIFEGLPTDYPKKIFISTLQDSDIDTDSCLFFSVHSLYSLTQSNTCMLRIKDSLTLDNAKVNALLSSLQASQKNLYTYQATYADSEIRTKIQDFKNTTDLLQLIAIVVFLIVSAGLSGVLLIFLNKRKSSIAITLALGSTFSIASLELIGEVFALYAIGAVVGTCLSVKIIPFFDTSIYSVQFHSISLLFAVLLVFILSIAVSANILGEIYKIQPMEILAREG